MADSMPTHFCDACGAEISADAHFCQKCGARVGLEATDLDGFENRTDDESTSPGDSSAMARFQRSVAARQQPDDDEEQELWSGRYSSKAMLGAWIGMAAITIAALTVGAFGGGLGLLIAGGIVLVMWLGLYLRLLYRQYSIRYRLTDQRFIHNQGVLSRTTDRIEVIDMDDITFSQGPIQRMVGVGRIRILSSDTSHPEIELLGIDDVERVFTMFDNARRQERRRRGLHIEAV